MKNNLQNQKGLSIHAYAMHRKEKGLPGRTDWSVKKAIRDGRISRNEFGKIDPEVADREWDKNTNPAQQRDPQKMSEAAIAVRKRRTLEDNVPPYAQSRAVKEAYQARIARIQYEELAGRVVSVEAVKVEAFRRTRMARDQILSVPDRIAAVLAAESDADRVYEILAAELRQALEVLSEN